MYIRKYLIRTALTFTKNNKHVYILLYRVFTLCDISVSDYNNIYFELKIALLNEI